MELQLIETDQGKKSLICDGYRYHVDKMLKSQKFPCVAKMGYKSGA